MSYIRPLFILQPLSPGLDNMQITTEPDLSAALSTWIRHETHFQPRYDPGGACREVLVTVMRKHQRYFPVNDQQGDLLPAFIAVANGRRDESVVHKGLPLQLGQGSTLSHSMTWSTN